MRIEIEKLIPIPSDNETESDDEEYDFSYAIEASHPDN